MSVFVSGFAVRVDLHDMQMSIAAFLDFDIADSHFFSTRWYWTNGHTRSPWMLDRHVEASSPYDPGTNDSFGIVQVVCVF